MIYFLCSEKLPFFRGNFRVQIPSKSLTRLQSYAIITRYKGRQDQVDTPEFRTNIFTDLFKKLTMYNFNVEGDMGRHYISISGACAECGISTSTIDREQGKTFPPKRKLSKKRVGFWVFQIVEWLEGKRGGWA